MKHVHLVGVSGTGMGALATLFRARGDRVTGSDVSFDPPIGPALRAAGVECLTGYDAAHLEPRPDHVVIGNAIRRDNVEAIAVEQRDLPRSSMSDALREHFLRGRRAVVVCGTHGKTTTSSLSAWVLDRAGLDPGYFIGGIPRNFGVGAAIGRSERSLVKSPAPFVVEGDEYDAVYWHKQPKFYDYVGVGPDDVVVVTSIEHDHIDIYPTERAYEEAFIGLFERVPDKGLVIVDVSQARAVELARKHARARVVTYGLDPSAEWSGVVAIGWHVRCLRGRERVRSLFARAPRRAQRAQRARGDRDGGRRFRRRAERVTRGARVVRGREAPARAPRGARRRQRVRRFRAPPDRGRRDAARASKAASSKVRSVAIFEPRSATACRNIHQEAYVHAFDAADRVLLAPLGRTNVPEAERLDLPRLARELGDKARACASVDEIIADVAQRAKPGDVIAVLSNGAFGGIHARLLDALARR